MLAHYSDDMTRWIKAIENATFARQRAAYDRVAAENARLRKLLSLGTGTIPGSPDMPDSPDLVRHSFRIRHVNPTWHLTCDVHRNRSNPPTSTWNATAAPLP